MANYIPEDGQTCGDFGGITGAGTPCTRYAGWGTDHRGDGPCSTHERSPEVIAWRKGRIGKPKDWDTAVSAAYLFLRGDYTNQEIADSCGIGLRTVFAWKRSDWWGKAVEEARGRWFQNIVTDGRRSLSKLVRPSDTPDGPAGDPATVRWLLERTDKELAPPRQQIELHHNYIHRDEVIEMIRKLASAAAEMVEDSERRKRLVVVAREIILGVEE